MQKSRFVQVLGGIYPNVRGMYPPVVRGDNCTGHCCISLSELRNFTVFCLGTMHFCLSLSDLLRKSVMSDEHIQIPCHICRVASVIIIDTLQLLVVRVRQT